MCRSETLVEDKFVGLGLRHGYNGDGGRSGHLAGPNRTVAREGKGHCRAVGGSLAQRLQRGFAGVAKG